MDTPVRIAAIDLLRILAAMAVLSHHWNWVAHAELRGMSLYPQRLARHGGYFGVTLFFMISGFVILKSARGASAERFVVSRAIRLYPAFWVCCTISWIATRTHGGKSVWDYLLNLTMFPEIFGAPMVDGVYWTLGLEAKFYLLIAAVIAFGNLAKVEGVLWGWLLLSRLAWNADASGVLMSTYAPFFIGGCACLLVSEQGTFSRWALLMGSLASGLIEASKSEGAIGEVFHVPPQPVLMCVVIGAFFALMLAVAKARVRLPATRVLVGAGAISYPLYLLHSQLGFRIFKTTASWPTGLPYVVALVAMIALAQAVVRFAEMPLQRWLRARCQTLYGVRPAKVGAATGPVAE